MPAADVLDYDKLNFALLRRFRLTVEGFRENFRISKPLEIKTGQQFAARLSNYFDHQLEILKMDRTFENLKNHIIAEQFLASFHRGATLFLKQCDLKTAVELAEQVDRCLEAEG
ncbi:hypothetical protein HPB51_028213 [Rhipicephalus microplus]|uniref:Uncharacterized protein n=1 Tax=Rhipicephalus microplus TaxID=6941 RepID=A0A9J6CXM0_RHIMP|nr:hypothetical protein HPB51_028213 [Rhipicephalus microplus]